MGRIIWVGPARYPAFRPWTEAAYLATSALFFAATWPGLAGTRVRWAPSPAPPAGGAPRLYLLAHRRIWTAPALFRAVPTSLRPALVAHDGVLSRLNQRCGTWAGLDVVVFQRRAPVRPVEQLAAFVKETGRDLLIAPDSGARPGTVRPGVVELARASGARVVPLAVSAEGGLSLRGQTLLVPGTRLEVRHGAPLDADAGAGEIRDALRSLESLRSAPGPTRRRR